MIKHTGIAILLGLGGFALGSIIARVTEKVGALPAGMTEAPPALRHISQLPPPPAAGKPAARSGR
ncbi:MULTISPECIES: hypothetical protein [Methylorubrum]|uniref:hypothetical protein n=1 Tax=Methylorubrum TaxID=2282523 RepID=UPI00209E593C|nr:MULTISPECIES: hypothetical protein [Methylorubrum]MCP1549568.1 hypothetical protein [Methylorubrum zatmanii]MCP1553818.1 hypothetical protein [Methylorubrum extorquens]MCP1579870.1 hypothetical protein [Methylorubrum extorquens]